MSIQGIIFGIQRFCVHDGPGIRTNVFLKGCNLRCAWCHNPESLAPAPQLSYRASDCVRCGACAQACKNAVHSVASSVHTVDASHCSACGECISACPTGALEIIGKRMSVQELLSEVLRDRLFFREDGGGLTVTGGEPLLQYDFLRALLHGARTSGIGTAIETNGTFPWPSYLALMEDLDILLVDFKHSDTRAHKHFTGIGNEQVLENLSHLAKHGKPVILRCPIIPGVNDTPEHLHAIAALTQRYPNIRYAELMPYHRFGMDKAARIGSDTVREFAVPTAGQIDFWKDTVRRNGGRLKEEFR